MHTSPRALRRSRKPSSTDFSNACTITEARANHLRYLIHLQHQFPNALGFIPRTGVEWYLEHGCVRLALENDAPAGYLLANGHLRWCIAIRPIFQAAVDMSAQRRHIGLALVKATADDARDAGQMALQAMCREGLEANDFWKAAGFIEISRYAPGNARKKEMICWRKPLSDYRPRWFNLAPPYAGWKAKKVTT